MTLARRNSAARFGLALTICASAPAMANAFEHYEGQYGLTVSPATLTIESADGMVHICGEPMFEAGPLDYAVSDGMLILNPDSDAEIDFDHMSGKKNDVYGTWQALDDGLLVVLHVNPSSLKVVSVCE